MTQFQRWMVLGVLPGMLVGVTFLFGFLRSDFGPSVAHSGEKKPAEKKPDAGVAPNPSPIVGTFSCSARGCHGGIEPHGDPLDLAKVWQNEYTQWTHDRHADAYRVLFSARSKNIAKLLGDKKEAHEDPRCLACHTNPQVAELPKSDLFAEQEKRFGVGCESCHGNANRWLVPHTDKSWRSLSALDKAKQGMVAVSDPVQRAEACAGCHVGAPKGNGSPLRDVNHDLIAAGHPRLSFEFGAFQANMPPHWRPDDKRSPDEKPIADDRLWTAGQIVSAEAALNLLSYRANAGPWPEFAEYDCFACHHSLAQPTWRQTAERGRRKPGALPWGSWYFALTRPLIEDRGLHADLDELEAIMQRPYPDRKEAASVSAKVRTRLQELAKGMDDASARKRILDVIAQDRTSAPESWDSAEQLYLALYALRPSSALSGLAMERAFPPGYDSPISAPRPGGSSFNPREFLEKLKSLPK